MITSTDALTTKIWTRINFAVLSMHGNKVNSRRYVSKLSEASKILTSETCISRENEENVKHDHPGEANLSQETNTCSPQQSESGSM